MTCRFSERALRTGRRGTGEAPPSPPCKALQDRCRYSRPARCQLTEAVSETLCCIWLAWAKPARYPIWLRIWRLALCWRLPVVMSAPETGLLSSKLPRGSASDCSAITLVAACRRLMPAPMLAAQRSHCASHRLVDVGQRRSLGRCSRWSRSSLRAMLEPFHLAAVEPSGSMRLEMVLLPTLVYSLR